MATHAVLGSLYSLTEALSLSVTSMGKLGIEMPHRNLLVMERTCISLVVTSMGIDDGLGVFYT